MTAAGEDTFLDDIERLLDKAVHTRSRYVKLSDRIARYYAPMVHATAAMTFIGWMLAGQSVACVYRYRNHGPDHHVPVRIGACDSRRSGGGGERAVPRRAYS